MPESTVGRWKIFNSEEIDRSNKTSKDNHSPKYPLTGDITKKPSVC